MRQRKWEIWDKNKAGQLATGWHNPTELQDAVFADGNGSHWQLVQMIFSLVEGHSILDVGCGMGHLYTLIKGGIDYLGIDNSKPMLKRAWGFFPRDRDKFKLGDAYDLSKLPQFDTVVATGLVLHLPDSEPVIAQLWSKAGICVVFSAWIGEEPILIETKQRSGTLIQRRETRDDLLGLFSSFKDLGMVGEFPFHNPDIGESNYIFKLWKKSGNELDRNGLRHD